MRCCRFGLIFTRFHVNLETFTWHITAHLHIAHSFQTMGLRYSYTHSPPLENATSLTGTPPRNSYTIPRDPHCPGRPKTHPAQQRSQNKRKVEDPARYDTPGPGQTGDPPLPSCHHTPPYPENPKRKPLPPWIVTLVANSTPKRRLSFLRHHVCYPSHPPLHHRLVTGCV